MNRNDIPLSCIIGIHRYKYKHPEYKLTNRVLYKCKDCGDEIIVGMNLRYINFGREYESIEDIMSEVL